MSTPIALITNEKPGGFQNICTSVATTSPTRPTSRKLPMPVRSFFVV